MCQVQLRNGDTASRGGVAHCPSSPIYHLFGCMSFFHCALSSSEVCFWRSACGEYLGQGQDHVHTQCMGFFPPLQLLLPLHLHLHLHLGKIYRQQLTISTFVKFIETSAKHLQLITHSLYTTKIARIRHTILSTIFYHPGRTNMQ